MLSRRSFFATLAAAFAVKPLRAIIRKAPHVAKPTGISIRVVRQYGTMGRMTRFDVLYGVQTIAPDQVCRIES